MLGWSVSTEKERKAKTVKYWLWKRACLCSVKRSLSTPAAKWAPQTPGVEYHFCFPPQGWQLRTAGSRSTVDKEVSDLGLAQVTRAKLDSGSGRAAVELLAGVTICMASPKRVGVASSLFMQSLASFLIAQVDVKSFQSRARVHQVDGPVIRGKCHFCTAALMFCSRAEAGRYKKLWREGIKL